MFSSIGRRAATTAIVLSLASATFGQDAGAPAASQNVADDQEVKLSVSLVQVDAVVTDKQRRQVTDLKASDFEIFEDGVPQQVTHCSYVRTSAATAPPSGPSGPGPGVRLRPDQVRRTIVFVVARFLGDVDDFDMVATANENAAAARNALTKFVDEEMRPGDLVAIVRSQSGVGALQQLTADRQVLKEAIKYIRPEFTADGNVSDAARSGTGDLSFSPALRGSRTPIGTEGSIGASQRAAEERTRAALAGGGSGLYAAGTLGTVQYVLRGLGAVPGRKAVVVLTNGEAPFLLAGSRKILPTDDTSDLQTALMQSISDQAARVSAAVYGVDVRGLQTFMPGADALGSGGADAVAEAVSAEFQSQASIADIARRTGGFLVHGTNDIAGGLRATAEDQDGYYLLAYTPAESTFNLKTTGHPYHRLRVRVKRADLTVRSRTGFYAVAADAEHPTRATSKAEQLADAIASPFAGAGIRVRLTPAFGYSRQKKGVIRCFVHVDARDLTLTPEPDGWTKITLDVGVVALDGSGVPINQTADTYSIRIAGETLVRVQKWGLVHSVDVPVKKTGLHQLRIAVRDAGSGRIGSAFEHVTVPDVANGKLALSSVVLRDRPGQNAGGSADVVSAALRRFKAGTALEYSVAIYNAKLDKATKQPQLTCELRLYRDGTLVETLQQAAPLIGAGAEAGAAFAQGALELGRGLVAGPYVLELIVTDPLAKEKYRRASRWIDFEVE
jgi:VWFA-related protein